MDDQINALFEGRMTSSIGTAATPLTKEMWEAAYGKGSYEAAKEMWPWMFPVEAKSAS